MGHAIMMLLVGFIELMFFCGVAGCIVTILFSWFSIFRDELIPPDKPN
jgi:hypothetical protein